MVKGLDLFRQHFADHADQYVLIGGTAATLAMEDAGLEFRATKDLDIVLHVEALNAAFGATFWTFVEQGRYEIRQASDTGRPVHYRFSKPEDHRFPAMLELFSRTPDGITLPEGSRLTPIPLAEAVASLSAILLDEAYYEFIMSGRRESQGLSWVGEDRLIVLKASACLDLTEVGDYRATDVAILTWARAHGRVLVTHDLDQPETANWLTRRPKPASPRRSFL